MPSKYYNQGLVQSGAAAYASKDIYSGVGDAISEGVNSAIDPLIADRKRLNEKAEKEAKQEREDLVFEQNQKLQNLQFKSGELALAKGELDLVKDIGIYNKWIKTQEGESGKKLYETVKFDREDGYKQEVAALAKAHSGGDYPGADKIMDRLKNRSKYDANWGEKRVKQNNTFKKIPDSTRDPKGYRAAMAIAAYKEDTPPPIKYKGDIPYYQLKYNNPVTKKSELVELRADTDSLYGSYVSQINVENTVSALTSNKKLADFWKAHTGTSKLTRQQLLPFFNEVNTTFADKGDRDSFIRQFKADNPTAKIEFDGKKGTSAQDISQIILGYTKETSNSPEFKTVLDDINEGRDIARIPLTATQISYQKESAENAEKFGRYQLGIESKDLSLTGPINGYRVVKYEDKEYLAEEGIVVNKKNITGKTELIRDENGNYDAATLLKVSGYFQIPAFSKQAIQQINKQQSASGGSGTSGGGTGSTGTGTQDTNTQTPTNPRVSSALERNGIGVDTKTPGTGTGTGDDTGTGTEIPKPKKSALSNLDFTDNKDGSAKKHLPLIEKSGLVVPDFLDRDKVTINNVIEFNKNAHTAKYQSEAMAPGIELAQKEFDEDKEYYGTKGKATIRTKSTLDKRKADFKALYGITYDKWVEQGKPPYELSKDNPLYDTLNTDTGRSSIKDIDGFLPGKEPSVGEITPKEGASTLPQEDVPDINPVRITPKSVGSPGRLGFPFFKKNVDELDLDSKLKDKVQGFIDNVDEDGIVLFKDIVSNVQGLKTSKANKNEILKAIGAIPIVDGLSIPVRQKSAVINAIESIDGEFNADSVREALLDKKIPVDVIDEVYTALIGPSEEKDSVNPPYLPGYNPTLLEKKDPKKEKNLDNNKIDALKNDIYHAEQRIKGMKRGKALNLENYYLREKKRLLKFSEKNNVSKTFSEKKPIKVEPVINKVDNDSITRIKKEEGYRSDPYQDVAGIWTIGSGLTSINGKKVTKNTKASKKVLEEQFDKQYDIAKKKVLKYNDKYKWTKNELESLISFTFNIGNIDTLTAKGTRTKPQIAAKILEYNKARVKGNLQPVKGLTKRRERENKLFTSK